MIFSLLILLPILGYALWVYFRTAPRQVPRAVRLRYNILVICLALGACAASSYFAYDQVGAGADRAWWPVVAGFYSWFAFLIVLILGGLVRNFLIFRARG